MQKTKPKPVFYGSPYFITPLQPPPSPLSRQSLCALIYRSLRSGDAKLPPGEGGQIVVGGASALGSLRRGYVIHTSKCYSNNGGASLRGKI